MSTCTRMPLLLGLACLAACHADWPDLTCATDECTTEPPSPGGPPGAPTTTEGPTGTGSTGSTGTGSETGAATEPPWTGEPEELPPTIVEFSLTPTPIFDNGPITISVTAERSDGIRVAIDDSEQTFDLVPAGRGQFVGELAVVSGFENGMHTAWLTPFRDVTVVGDVLPAPYEVALLMPGEQGKWETGDLIGKGQVAALAALPTGDIIEIGTRIVDDVSRCYLRRRDATGAWQANDVLPVLPDFPCTASDVAIDPSGAILVLVDRVGADGKRWWFGKIAQWRAGAEENLMLGGEDETVKTIAAHPSGAVAVCGFAPAGDTVDDDGLVRVHRPGQSELTRVLDYDAPDNDPHKFSERLRDCAFAGDRLIAVGSAWGRHGQEDVERNRLTMVEFDGLAFADASWHVEAKGAEAQSVAQKLTFDDKGRLIVAAYVCDDNCKPEAELRSYDKGALVRRDSLGLFTDENFGTMALEWSPSGHVVVASGGMVGSEASFLVRAYSLQQVLPAWTFERKDGGQFHMALALALGPWGDVYVGGMGANGFPAFAEVGG